MNVEISGFPKKGEAWQEASRLIEAANGKGADCLDYLRKGIELGRRVSHELGLSRIENLNAAHRQQLEALNESWCQREVVHRLSIVDERINAARLAACGSGWDEGVVRFVVDRIEAVRDVWARRWRSDGGDVAPYPTVAEFAVEVGRWCDAYADMLEALPSLLMAARDRRAKGLEDERERAARAERLCETLKAVKDDTAAIRRNLEVGRKPSATLRYAELVETMRGICRSEAVDERTLRRWVSVGRTSSGFAISHADMLTPQSWHAWCKSYFDHETGRMHTRQFFDERRDGAVGDAPARPRR